MRILAVSGSLRADSYNTALARAAVELDDQRERSVAARLEETSQQRAASVTDVFDVFDVNLVVHRGLSSQRSAIESPGWR